MELPSSLLNPRIAGNATVTREKGETVSSSGLETERWLGIVPLTGAKASKSGPDLAPDQEDLGPREKEVVMSAALVLTGRVC